MTKHVDGKFEVMSWEEDQYRVLTDGGKLTHASVTQTFSGEIAGHGDVEWLMCYRGDGTANVTGFQNVEGELDGRAGSFVLQMTGTFDGKEARGRWFVVAGSGTGELTGLRGEGEMVAPLGQSTATVSLDYDLE